MDYSKINHDDLSAERIAILDFSTGKVYIRFVPVELMESDASEIMYYFETILPIRESDCQYMIVNDDDYIEPVWQVIRSGADALPKRTNTKNHE